MDSFSRRDSGLRRGARGSGMIARAESKPNHPPSSRGYPWGGPTKHDQSPWRGRRRNDMRTAQGGIRSDRSAELPSVTPSNRSWALVHAERIGRESAKERPQDREHDDYDAPTCHGGNSPCPSNATVDCGDTGSRGACAARGACRDGLGHAAARTDPRKRRSPRLEWPGTIDQGGPRGCGCASRLGAGSILSVYEPHALEYSWQHMLHKGVRWFQPQECFRSVRGPFGAARCGRIG